MSETTPTPTAVTAAENVAAKVDAVLKTPEAQAVVKQAESKIPPTGRQVIYKLSQYVGVAIALGTAAEGVLHGAPDDFVGTAVGLFVVAQGLLADLNVTK